MMSAVTFDFGQTLAVLDTDFLAKRCAERGVKVPAEALEEALPVGFAAYDAAIRAGLSGHPWQHFMATVLATAGVESHTGNPLADWLLGEQPRANLWRRPIPGMIELVRALRRESVMVGVISNSEGHLARLATELGWAADFAVISDSGVLGVEKPGARIFELTAEALGVSLEALVHVGDSLEADVRGALAAGASAVWFAPTAAPLPGELLDEPRLRRAADAAAVHACLRSLGVCSGATVGADPVPT